MTYSTPFSRLEAIRDVLGALENAERVILTTHINADGDGAGSEVALAGWLRARGGKSWILNPTPFPASLGFLLPDRGWAPNIGSSQATEVAESADLVVILDTGEFPRIGPVAGLIQNLPKVVVDHHPVGSDPIDGISFRDPGACATGELVFDILQRAGGPWSPEIVQGLYVALLADTGSFRFSNTTPGTHQIAAFLIENGADPEETHRLLYGNVPLRKLRLLRGALGELEVDPGGDLAWMTVPSQLYEELGARADDIEGLVDYPRAIQGVQVGLLFRETARGATKVSFRSNGKVDVNALARQFGGGGHVKASGALVNRPLSQVRDEVLEVVRAGIRGGNGDGEG